MLICLHRCLYQVGSTQLHSCRDREKLPGKAAMGRLQLAVFCWSKQQASPELPLPLHKIRLTKIYTVDAHFTSCSFPKTEIRDCNPEQTL